MIWESLDLAIGPVGLECKQHWEKWFIEWDLSISQHENISKGCVCAWWVVCSLLTSHVPFTISHRLCVKSYSYLANSSPGLTATQFVLDSLTPWFPLILVSAYVTSRSAVSNLEIRYSTDLFHFPFLHHPNCPNAQLWKNLDTSMLSQGWRQRELVLSMGPRCSFPHLKTNCIWLNAFLLFSILSGTSRV